MTLTKLRRFSSSKGSRFKGSKVLWGVFKDEGQAGLLLPHLCIGPVGNFAYLINAMSKYFSFWVIIQQTLEVIYILSSFRYR